MMSRVCHCLATCLYPPPDNEDLATPIQNLELTTTEESPQTPQNMINEEYFQGEAQPTSSESDWVSINNTNN